MSALRKSLENVTSIVAVEGAACADGRATASVARAASSTPMVFFMEFLPLVVGRADPLCDAGSPFPRADVVHHKARCAVRRYPKDQKACYAASAAHDRTEGLDQA